MIELRPYLDAIDDATLVRQSLPVPSRDSPAEITLMR